MLFRSLGLARDAGAIIEQALALNGNQAKPMRVDAWGPNLFAEGAIFLLTKR